jgi:hypothetical protein
MTYRLYLDDVRPCPDGDVLARNFWEARRIVAERGFPNHVSFDHDLGMIINEEIGGLVSASEDPNEKTGMDFAKWLCGHDVRTGLMPEHFTFSVHSANPVGAKNIQLYMENYMRLRKAP